MIAAIYTRLSPTAKKNDTINQERDLLEYCKRSGWEVYQIYKDVQVSGSLKGVDRPKFKQMMLDASKKKFEVVLFWSLDRFSREGTYETMTYLRTLSEYGVGFKSYSEPTLDTTNEMIRNIVLTVMAELAKQEKKRIVERTIAGLITARAKGKILGRPTVTRKTKKRPNPVTMEELKQMSMQGLSYTQMVIKLKEQGKKIGKGTIWRMLNRKEDFIN